MLTIHAEKRNTQQKAKQVRKNGMFPGNLFGRGIKDSVLLQFPRNEVQKILALKSVDVTVNLEIEGEKTVALLREIGAGPRSRRVENLSFQKISDDEYISSTAQVLLTNTEMYSAYPQQELFDIPYRALGSDLVEQITIDLKGYKVGDVIRVKDLELAKNEKISLLIDLENPVLSIVESVTSAGDDADIEVPDETVQAEQV